MTREEKLLTILQHKNLDSVDVEFDFELDSPISQKSFQDFERIKAMFETVYNTAARKLNISSNVFKGCDTDDVIELMETIFWIEANGENKVEITDRKVIMDIPKLYPYLENYRNMKSAAEHNMISNKSYIDWKLNWNRNIIPRE
ncbi:MAG: hypothetical protein IKE65_02645 [Clostridia bacterium]|nr:hypothetical protein [Clostridia bacterium]